MKFKKYNRLTLGLVVFVVAISVTVAVLGLDKDSAFFNNLEDLRFIDANFYELEELIKESVEQVQNDSQNQYQDEYIQMGITSHHLPTAVSLISKLYHHLESSQGPRDVFVILGPDHFERGYTSVSTTFYPFVTPFGKLEIEDEIVKELVENGVSIDNEALVDEHAIGVQAIFIKYLFPQAKIVPLIFRLDADEQVVAKIAEVLKSYQDKITIITSVDFSHYQSYQSAQLLDAESERMIANFNFDSFTLEYVDSPPSLRLVGQLVDLLGIDEVDVFDNANSYEFTGKNILSTTGYLNVFFSKKDLGSGQTLVLVGDMMLSRSVGDKMERENNWLWPFLKIKDYFEKADLLFANLEGPISDQGRNVGSIYSFRADPRVISGLKYAGFDILSVANNHMGDWGRQAMEDTFKILKENDIDYVGGGNISQEAHSPVIKELDNGLKVAFLAYTNLGSKYWEAQDNLSGIAWLEQKQMIKDINEAEQEADIIIVSMHFGEEYLTYSNASQQFFARAAINAGADLVAGHHPHVVQEIEKYKDGYIAYSLGNFIFDQNFSELTRKGLILEVLIKNKRIEEIKLVEIRISDSFQSELIF